VDFGSNNLLVGNNVYSNDFYGIFLNNPLSKYNRVISNRVWGLNQNYGLFLQNASQTLIFSNQIMLNATDGINLSAAYLNYIFLNDIYANGIAGIDLNGLSTYNNRIASNRFFGTGNQDAGLRFYNNSRWNYVYLNEIISNDVCGIWFTNSRTNYVFDNNIFGQKFAVSNNTDASTGNVCLSNYFGAVSLTAVLATNIGIGSNDIVPYRLGPVGILQPVTAPPAVPVFTAVTNMTDGVALYWTNNQAGVSGYHLWRSTNDTWTNYTSWLSNIPGGGCGAYTDSGTGYSTNYYYHLTAYDGQTIPNESWFSEGASGCRRYFSASLHVSNGGNDGNFGTLASPFLTLQQAISNLMPEHFTNGNMYIWLHGGVHTFGPTVISNADWAPGEASNLVISGWTNAPAKSAIISNLDGGYAVLFTNTSHVVLTNLFFTGSRNGSPGDSGISLGRASSVSLLDLTVRRFTNNILLSSGSYSNNVHACDLNCAKFSGVKVLAGSNNIFSGNDFYSNELYGIWLSGSTARCNQVLSNDFRGTGQYYGVYTTGPENLFYSNRFRHHSIGGFYANGAKSNNVFLNDFYSNISMGILLAGSGALYNRFASNRLFGPGCQEQGFQIHSQAHFNYIYLNEITSNLNHGIWITNAETNFIFDNNIFGQQLAISNNIDTSTNNICLSNYFGSVNLSLVLATNAGLYSNDLAPYRLGHIGIFQADTTPPAVPVFTAISNLPGGLALYWTNDQADVSGYHLWRSTTNTWTNYTAWSFNLAGAACGAYTDIAAGEGTNYYYHLTVYDGQTLPNESWFSTPTNCLRLTDTSPPYAELTNPAPGQYLSGPVNFRGTNWDAESGLAVTRLLVTNLSGLVTNLAMLQNGSEFTNIWDTIGVSDGRYYAFVTATNGWTLGTNTASREVLVNNIAPLIAQTNTLLPAGGTNSGALAFAGYATNIAALFDPPAVYFATNNGSFALVTNAAAWRTNFDSTALGEGTNVFRFLAVSSNYRSNYWTQTNIIDHSPPWSAVTNYTNGALMSGTVTLTGTNGENWSTVTGCALYTNGGWCAWTNVDWPWLFTINSGIFTNGLLQIALAVSNSVGLVATNTWTNIVTNLPLTVVFISPTNSEPLAWCTGVSIITGYVTNLGDALVTVEFSTDGSTWRAPAGNLTNWYTNWDPLPFDARTNILRVRAVSVAGVAATNYLTNRVDTTAPVLGLSALTNNAFLTGVTNLAGAASESNVDPVTFLTLIFSNSTASRSFNLLSSLSGTNWSFLLATTNMTNGRWDLALVASNEAGLGSALILTNLYISNLICFPVSVGFSNAPASASAGYDAVLTMLLFDQNNQPYTGALTINDFIFAGLANTSSGYPALANGTAFGSPTAVNFSGGIAALTIRPVFARLTNLVTASSTQFAVTSTGYGWGQPISVTPGAADTAFTKLSAEGTVAVLQTRAGLDVYLDVFDYYSNQVTNITTEAVISSSIGENIPIHTVISNRFIGTYQPAVHGSRTLSAMIEKKPVIHDSEGTDDGILHIDVYLHTPENISKFLDYNSNAGSALIISKNPVRLGERAVGYYTAPAGTVINIEVRDMIGRKIKQIVSNQPHNDSAINVLEWDLTSISGVKVPRGLYYVILDVRKNGAELTPLVFKLMVIE